MSKVGARNQENLERNLEWFRDQWTDWNWVPAHLQRAGLPLTSLRELSTRARQSSWLAFTSPNESLSQHFELAPEVLVLISPWKEIQATDIRRAEEAFRNEVRLDPGFVLVITGDPNAAARLESVVPDHRRYLFIQGSEFEGTNNAEAFIRQRLRDALGRRRLFDARVPATGPQFFGRERELEALERDLLTGHSVGLYGLRKVGKTSLLRRLAEKLGTTRPAKAPVLVVEVDLLALPWSQQNRSGVVSAIARQLAHAQKQPLKSGVDGQQALQAAIEQSSEGARVLVILDEYEKLLGPAISVRDGLAVLDWLRGLAQAHPGVFSFMLVGRNARLLAPARIDGLDNPMYRFLRSVPLAGLSPEECRSMVRKLGRRMGLAFDHPALERIAEVTGGHAALARTLGDLVDQSIPAEERNPAPVGLAHVEKVLRRFMVQVDEDMRELVNAALDFDERAEEFLQHLAHDQPWGGGVVEERLRSALEGYGILSENGRFRIACFYDWLRDNYAPPVRALAHG